MDGQLNLTQPACPPDHLAKRASGTVAEEFEAQGQEIRDCIVRSLPADFNFLGKRVLDFGCGAGRVLRYFPDRGMEWRVLGL